MEYCPWEPVTFGYDPGSVPGWLQRLPPVPQGGAIDFLISFSWTPDGLAVGDLLLELGEGDMTKD